MNDMTLYNAIREMVEVGDLTYVPEEMGQKIQVNSTKH